MNRVAIAVFLFSFLLMSCQRAKVEVPASGGKAAVASDSSIDKPGASGSPAAKDILGNADYPAFCYGGYRGGTREEAPTIEQLKQDVRILHAMGTRVLRTYNTQQYSQAANLLEAIQQLRQADATFEMYVMLGAWIECKDAWNDKANHAEEHFENNSAEIRAAVELAKKYPDIVKVIAVGNECMVHWATSYFVSPTIVLKWVNHLQDLKKSGELPGGVWITSSDNYAAWGGDDSSYHTPELTELIRAVDYVSLHTYPFHDSYYNPKFWTASASEDELSAKEKADKAMARAQGYAEAQFRATANYIRSLGIEKPIHIGETGWASSANASYGATGSQAADEYKAKLFYESMRAWTNKDGISCFYFEAFDENWKDEGNPGGSENHFGLFDLKGQAKYALWDQVDAKVFDGLVRDGAKITKSFGGDEAALLASILKVPSVNDLGSLAISTTNSNRNVGEPVTEQKYVVAHPTMVPDGSNDMSFPSDALKLNVWEGTCGMERSADGVIHVSTGTGGWWGCALEIQGDGKGENLSQFKDGKMHFEIKGDTGATFAIGFQTGQFLAGTQTNNFVTFGGEQKYKLTEEWSSYSIGFEELNKDADFTDVTGVMYLRSDKGSDGKKIDVRNVYFSR